MFKLFIVVLFIAIFVIIMINLIKYLLGPHKKKTSGVSSLEELKSKASNNFQEREAIRQEVNSTEQVLEEIKSKTI